MTPLGAAGSGPVNTASILREARARVSAKRGGIAGSQTTTSALADLLLPRGNEFEQKIEEDGLPTTVLYDAFGRFRRAILPRGQIVDIYM